MIDVYYDTVAGVTLGIIIGAILSEFIPIMMISAIALIGTILMIYMSEND